MPVDRMLHPKLLDSEKIGALTSLEFRVWITYMLVADDFGVMPMEAPKIQVTRALAKEHPRKVSAALERLVDLRVVHRFKHQRQPLIWTRAWQFHQKFRYPRRDTHYPAPPESILESLDDAKTISTRALFATFHPGVSESFRQRFGDLEEIAKYANKKARNSDADSGNVPGTPPERSGLARGRSRARPRNGLRLEANGERQTADGTEGGAGETTSLPFDNWLKQLLQGYPPQGLTSGNETEAAFAEVFTRDDRPPECVFTEMLEHLDNQKRGYQWRVKRMIPKLERWLREGLWRQLHDETPPLALVSERTLHTEMAAEAFVRGGLPNE